MSTCKKRSLHHLLVSLLYNSITKVQLDPSNVNSVFWILFFKPKSFSLGFSRHSVTNSYFKLLLFQANFCLPWEFKIVGFNCTDGFTPFCETIVSGVSKSHAYTQVLFHARQIVKIYITKISIIIILRVIILKGRNFNF